MSVKHYALRHVTKYRYSSPVRESAMEIMMQPRSEGGQVLRSFQVTTSPRAQLFAYTDHLGNAVYHFDIPQPHQSLTIDVESVVEVMPRSPAPAALAGQDWTAFEPFSREQFDMLVLGNLMAPTPLLAEFIAAHDLGRDEVRGRLDPLTALRQLNQKIFEAFDYDPRTTEVDSPIDHALETKRGVCQDFAHIMLAVTRGWGIPSRYVSGYLFHRAENHDRSAVDASHAWVECFLPEIGWIGFDPTNNILVEDRHVRVAIGRDYEDVPPTRGVYKGNAQSELAVAVKVTASRAPDRHEDFLRVVRPMRPERESDSASQQQQQQQQ